jgi:hypothetical protein
LEDGAIWQEVGKYIADAVDVNGQINENSALYNLLKTQEGFSSMSKE